MAPTNFAKEKDGNAQKKPRISTAQEDNVG
jgi:hypothetical protein